MVHKSLGTKHEHPSICYRRFRAALDLRGLSIESLARRARVSSRHVWFVLNGQRRASASVLRTLREQVGESGWRFATRQEDTLRDDGGDHAAR